MFQSVKDEERESIGGDLRNTDAGLAPPAAMSEDARNDDRKGLGARPLGRMAMGRVDEVNGKGSRPCPDYVPTRYEVLELARHWSERLLGIGTSCFYDATVGSDDWRTYEYAKRQLDRVAEALGTDTVEAVYRDVEAGFRKEMGERDWHVFKHGSHEERQRFRAELRVSDGGCGEQA